MGDTINRLTFPKRQDRVYNDAELCAQLQSSGSKPMSMELEGVPPDPLPTWLTLPLETKLPMLPCPKGSVVLFTTNIGEKIHKRDPELGFDLSDPRSLFMSNDYKPLHDPHLKQHLVAPQMRKRLRRGGFVTADGKVLCSLKEYNIYRQYLRRINLKLERNKMQEMIGDHPSYAKVKRVINSANEARHAKVKAIKDRLARQHKEDKEKYSRILGEDDERVTRMRKEQMMKIIQCQRAAREREFKRLETAKQKQHEENLRRMAIIRSWMEDDARRRDLANARLREKTDERQRMLEQSWDHRKSIQQEKISGDLTRQLLLDQEKRKRITERELILTKQLQRQEEQFLKLTERRRGERELLEQIYLRKFAAKIERRRAASARRRERRQVLMRRRYERLRPRSNWDIERSILQAIDEWGHSYSDGEIQAEDHKRESFLRIFQGDKGSSQKSIADLSLGDYKGASFNTAVVQTKSTESLLSNQNSSVRFVDSIDLQDTTNSHGRTNAQELYEILKSQRLKEEDDSNLDDVEKAAKAIVDMTVFLTTQVIYPAYLTYMREDHPELYSQYYERPTTPLPIESCISVGGRESLSVTFKPDDENIPTEPDHLECLRAYQYDMDMYELEEYDADDEDAYEHGCSPVRLASRDSLTLTNIETDLSKNDITKLLKCVLDQIASGVLNADQAQQMACMAKQLLGSIPTSPVESKHSVSPATSVHTVSDSAPSETSALAEEIVFDALRDVQDTLFERVMDSTSSTSDLAKFLVSKAIAHATHTMVRLSQSKVMTESPIQTDLTHSKSSTSDFVNKVLGRVVKDIGKELGYDDDGNELEESEASRFVSNLITQAASQIRQSRSKFENDEESMEVMPEPNSSDSIASQFVRDTLFKVVQEIATETPVEGNNCERYSGRDSPQTSFAGNLLLDTLRRCIQELRHDRIPQSEMLQITSAILRTRPTLAGGYYRTHIPLEHTRSVDDLMEYNVDLQTSNSLMIEALIRDTLKAVKRDLDNEAIGPVEILKLARDTDMFVEPAKAIPLTPCSSHEAESLVADAIQNTFVGLASNSSRRATSHTSVIADAYVQQALVGVSMLSSDEKKPKSDTSLAAELAVQLAFDDAINDIEDKKPETPLRTSVSQIAEELVRKAIDDILMTDATASRLANVSPEYSDYDNASVVNQFLGQMLRDLHEDEYSDATFPSHTSFSTECEGIVRDVLGHALKNLKDNDMHSTTSSYTAESIVDDVLEQVIGRLQHVGVGPIPIDKVSASDSKTSSIEQVAFIKETLRQVLMDLSKVPTHSDQQIISSIQTSCLPSSKTEVDNVWGQMLHRLKIIDIGSTPESTNVDIIIRNTLQQVLHDLQRSSSTQKQMLDISNTSLTAESMVDDVIGHMVRQLKKGSEVITDSASRSSSMEQEVIVRDVLQQVIRELRCDGILDDMQIGKSESTSSLTSEVGTIVNDVLGQVVKHLQQHPRDGRNISRSSSPEEDAIVRGTLYEVLNTLKNDMLATDALNRHTFPSQTSVTSEAGGVVNAVLAEMVQCLNQTGVNTPSSQNSSAAYENIVRGTLAKVFREYQNDVDFDPVNIEVETIVNSILDKIMQQLQQGATTAGKQQPERYASTTSSSAVAESLVGDVLCNLVKQFRIGSHKISDSASRSSSLEQEAIVLQTLQHVIRELKHSDNTDVIHIDNSSTASEAGTIVNDVLGKVAQYLHEHSRNDPHRSYSSSSEQETIVRNTLYDVLIALKCDMLSASVSHKHMFASKASSVTSEVDDTVNAVLSNMIWCLNQADVSKSSSHNSSIGYDNIVRGTLSNVLKELQDDVHFDSAEWEAEVVVNSVLDQIMQKLQQRSAVSDRASNTSSMGTEVVNNTLQNVIKDMQGSMSDPISTNAEALINQILGQMTQCLQPKSAGVDKDSDSQSSLEQESIVRDTLRQVFNELRHGSAHGETKSTRSSSLASEAEAVVNGVLTQIVTCLQQGNGSTQAVDNISKSSGSSLEEAIVRSTLGQVLKELRSNQGDSTSQNSSFASEAESIVNDVLIQVVGRLQNKTKTGDNNMPSDSLAQQQEIIIQNTLSKVLKDIHGDQSEARVSSEHSQSTSKTSSMAYEAEAVINTVLSDMVDQLQKTPSLSKQRISDPVLLPNANVASDKLSQVIGSIKCASNVTNPSQSTLETRADAVVNLVMDKVMQKMRTDEVETVFNNDPVLAVVNRSNFEQHVIIQTNCEDDEDSSSDGDIAICPMINHLPVNIDHHHVENALSVISVKNDADLIYHHENLAARNSFADLIHPDIARVKRFSDDSESSVCQKIINVSKTNISLPAMTSFSPSNSVMPSSYSADSTCKRKQQIQEERNAKIDIDDNEEILNVVMLHNVESLDDVQVQNSSQHLAIQKAPSMISTLPKESSSSNVKVSSKTSLAKKWSTRFPGRKNTKLIEDKSKLIDSKSQVRPLKESTVVPTSITSPKKSEGRKESVKKSTQTSSRTNNKIKKPADSDTVLPAQKSSSKTLFQKALRRSSTEMASPNSTTNKDTNGSNTTCFMDIVPEKTNSDQDHDSSIKIPCVEVSKKASNGFQECNLSATEPTITSQQPVSMSEDNQSHDPDDECKIITAMNGKEPQEELDEMQTICHNMHMDNIMDSCITSGRISPDAETIDEEELPVLMKISKKGGISDVHVHHVKGVGSSRTSNTQLSGKSSHASNKPSLTTVSRKDVYDITHKLSKALSLSSKASKLSAKSSKSGVGKQSSHQMVNLTPRPSSGYRKSPTAQSIANAVNSKELIKLEDAEEILKSTSNKDMENNFSLSPGMLLPHLPKHLVHSLMPKKSILSVADLVRHPQRSHSKTSSGSESLGEAELEKALSDKSCTHSDDYEDEVTHYHVKPQHKISTGSLPGARSSQNLLTRKSVTGNDSSNH